MIRARRKLAYYESLEIIEQLVPERVTMLRESIEEVLSLLEISESAGTAICRVLKTIDSRSIDLRDECISMLINRLAPISAIQNFYFSYCQMAPISKIISACYCQSIRQIFIEGNPTVSETIPDYEWLRHLPNLHTFSGPGSTRSHETVFPLGITLSIRHLILHHVTSELDIHYISMWPNLEVLDVTQIFGIRVRNRGQSFPRGTWNALRSVKTQAISTLNNFLGMKFVEELEISRVMGLAWAPLPEFPIYPQFQRVIIRAEPSPIRIIAGSGDGKIYAREIVVCRNANCPEWPEGIELIPNFFILRSVENVYINLADVKKQEQAIVFLRQKGLRANIFFFDEPDT